MIINYKQLNTIYHILKIKSILVKYSVVKVAYNRNEKYVKKSSTMKRNLKNI